MIIRLIQKIKDYPKKKKGVMYYFDVTLGFNMCAKIQSTHTTPIHIEIGLIFISFTFIITILRYGR